jgi:2,4-dichlorophenol 6-monooxygenase
MGDAAHRHPPSNGLGSNTSIQDGFNLAWKLAAVVKGQATPKLLDSYSAERAPIARQIVTRANQSIAEFGPIFEALGMDGGVDHDKIQRNMDARCDATPAAEAQREALRKAIEFKKYEFDCHGVEMNQRYASGAVVAEGQPPAPNADMELHYQPITYPGARIPHVWVYDRQGGRHSTLDLTGKGQFTLITGIGGEAWIAAAGALSTRLGMPIRVVKIGPRCAVEDHGGDWARAREICDAGCLLVRPDQHVAWRNEGLTATPEADLARVLSTILGH